ncbi:Nn.00g079050.m01.CDS01 [Neocucurbitaria sp. VM-36]
MVLLLDLPAEILREILVRAVTVRGLKRALRLRLVNRLFSQEITQALLASSIPDEYIAINEIETSRWPGRSRWSETSREPEYHAFWQAYLTNRVMSQRGPLLPLLKFVHKVAEHLCKATGDRDVGNLRNYVHNLCYWAYQMLKGTRSPRSEPPHWDQPHFLLRAAIITGCSAVVEHVLNGPDFVAAFTPRCAIGEFEPWQSAVYLAAQRGHTNMLEKAFLDRRLDTRELREVALSAAIREGDLPLMEFIMEPRWGPPDFFSSSLCVEENLVAGIMQSPRVDFFARVFDLFASHKTLRYPIEIHPPDINKILYHVAYSKPQRVDVAEWLLAAIHREAPQRFDLGKRGSQLHRAVTGGNEKIARLLLPLLVEHGAQPNGTDADVLVQTTDPGRLDIARPFIERIIPDIILAYPVKSGRLDIVRMLVEFSKEAKANLHLKHRVIWELERTPIVEYAIMTENTELCSYLIANGAQCRDALTKAVEVGLESMVHFLLENGVLATVDMLNMAKKMDHPEIVHILTQSLGTLHTAT